MSAGKTQPSQSLFTPFSDDGGFVVAQTLAPVLATPRQATLAARPAHRGSFPSAAELFQAFRRRWPLALLVGLLIGGTLGVATWFLKPATYTAAALIRVASIEPHLLPADQAAFRGDTDAFQRTQMALVKTKRVLTAALQNERVANLGTVASQSDPVAWLEDELKINYIEGTELLRIALSGDNPKEVADIVNAVKDAYLREVADKERDSRLLRYNELDKALQESENNLGQQRALVQRLAASLNTADTKQVQHIQRLELDEYAALRAQYARLQADISAATVALVAQQAALKPKNGEFKVPEHLILLQLDAEPSVVALNQEVIRLEVQVADYRRRSTAGVAPAHLLTGLEAARQAVTDQKNALRPNVEKKIAERIRGEAEREMGSTEAKLGALKGQQEDLERAIKDQKKAVENIGKNSIDLEMRRAEIEQLENVIRIARSEKERLWVELKSTSRRIRDEESAQVPQRRNWRPQIASAGLAGFWGLLLGLLGVSYREHRYHRISGKQDISQHFDMLVFGSLPLIRGERKRVLPLPGRRKCDWGAILRESVDGIRTTLMRNELTESRRVLVVSSPRSGEGKTTLSVHLAASIARSRRSVLLVDGDLHHPSIHRLFDLPSGPGLSDVLRGETDLHEAVQPGSTKGLFVLRAGTMDPDEVHLFAQPNLAELLLRARSEFDYVILDCSPVLPVVDCLLVGAHADGVILSIRPGISQLTQLHDACERLRAARIPILGAVVNGVDVAASAYDYPYQRTPALTASDSTGTRS